MVSKWIVFTLVFLGLSDSVRAQQEVPPSISVQVMWRTGASTRQSIAPGALVEIVDTRGRVIRWGNADPRLAKISFNALPVNTPVWIRVTYRGVTQYYGLNFRDGVVPFPNARGDRRHQSCLIWL